MATIYASICGPYQLRVFYAVCLDRQTDISSVRLICNVAGGVGLATDVCQLAEKLGFCAPLNLGDFQNESGSLDLRRLKGFIINEKEPEVSEFWHSLGDEVIESILVSLLNPSRVCFYEDGFSSVMKVRRLSFSDTFRSVGRAVFSGRFVDAWGSVVWCARMVRHLRSGEYWITSKCLWETLGRSVVNGVEVAEISRSALRSSFEACSDVKPIKTNAIFLTNVYSERGYCKLGQELENYRKVLECVRMRGISCTVKLHPRTSMEKAKAIEDLCIEAGASLLAANKQTLESLLLAAGSQVKLVVGPPTTALINVGLLQLGVGICLGDSIFVGTEHVGQSTTAIFKAANVIVPDSLADLDEAVADYCRED